MPTSTPSGRSVDIAIDGVEFRCAPTPQRPYQRGLADQRRQQFDASTNPGEQSLSGFWLRSQQDFTGGAGGTFMEPSNDEWAMKRFAASKGVNVWERGRLSLLNDTSKVRTLGVAGARSVAAGDGYYFTVAGGSVYVNGLATATITGWTNTPQTIASIGDAIIVGHSTGIDWCQATSTTRYPLWTGASGVPSLWWVKQRIIAAIGPSLYELSAAGGVWPSAYYTHPIAGWTWTAAVDTPGAILVSGYAGSKSAIYRITVDNSGALPTLTKAATCAELPEGEWVTGMFTYLGTYVVLGTNKGVRVAEVDTEGNLVYGPLTFTSTATTQITGFAGKDRFVYVGVGAELDGQVGLIRIDLSSTDGQGRYAWATDLACTGSYQVSSVAVMPNGAIVFTGGDLFLELLGQAVASGYVRTGLVRYNTLDSKQFRSYRVWGKNTGGSSVLAQLVDESGTLTDSTTYSGATFDQNVTVSTASGAVTSLGMKLTLTSANSGAEAPTVSGWLLRAVPASPRRTLIRVPLLCFDRERDVNNVPYGREGYAWERVSAVEAAAGTGRVVTYQDFRTGESRQVTVEDVQFTQADPGTSKDGFGGVLEVTVQTA